MKKARSNPKGSWKAKVLAVLKHLRAYKTVYGVVAVIVSLTGADFEADKMSNAIVAVSSVLDVLLQS